MKILSNNIVIAGMDGRFPKSNNMEELERNLFNKIDMSSDDEMRWSPADYPDMSKRTQYIDDLGKFDAELFKIHPKQVEVMDPQARILLEKAYAAILDGGVHPATLKGSNTGVFVANTNHEMMSKIHVEPADPYTMTGAHPSLLSNRISHALDLKGPSITIDTACSSSIFATLLAVNSMRLNQCDAALVCGTNLLLNPNLTAHMMKIGVISPDGTCWSFDNRGNGFIRAETIAVMFLQRRSNAKRIYAEIVHVAGSNDGYKSIGISSPCGRSQSELFSEFYREVQIDPLTVEYVEGHITGTVSGDREECFAIDKTFCNRRMVPLLVGAIKPNMGHSEAASGLCSIAKVIHAFQTGMVPATIHVQNLRKDIPSLTEGRLKVCTETTPLPGPLVAVNSFGLGGANGHLLLRRWNKEKEENLSRMPCVLVVWAGRTEQAVATVIDKVKSMPLNREFVGLLHEIQQTHVPENCYRGFGVFEGKDTETSPLCLNEETCHASENERRPIVWMFSGLGCQWTGMAKSMMQFRPFYDSILKCHNIMQKHSVDLISMITATDDIHALDNISSSLVAITAIQLALVDMLLLLGVPVDYMVGHSNGELGCAYADGTATLAEALQSAYLKGKAVSEEQRIVGLMAAVGMGQDQIRDRLPPGVYVGCHNSSASCTISGPRKDVFEFIEQLKSDKIFVKEVSSSGHAFHSKYVKEAGTKYLSYLQEVMPVRALRSSKWISSSVPYREWKSDLYKYNSAEYHVNNFLRPVLFQEACSRLPHNAIVIEIAPHGLLQSSMKKMLPNAITVPLMQRDNSNNAAFFLAAMGSLFNIGISLQIGQIYPVDYPVARGTPMIAPLVKYDHQQNWSVPKFTVSKKDSIERKITIDVSQEQYQYLLGHIVDGHCTMAGSTYNYLVWETMALFLSKTDLNTFNVELTNIEYHRRVTLSANTPLQLVIAIHKSGNFEVIEGDTAVATGMIRHCTPDVMTSSEFAADDKGGHSIVLSKSEIYSELQLRGYRFTDDYQGLESFCWNNKAAKIKWNGNWETFMDAMAHVFLMSRDTRASHLATGVARVTINAVKHSKWLTSLA